MLQDKRKIILSLETGPLICILRLNISKVTERWPRVILNSLSTSFLKTLTTTTSPGSFFPTILTTCSFSLPIDRQFFERSHQPSPRLVCSSLRHNFRDQNTGRAFASKHYPHDASFSSYFTLLATCYANPNFIQFRKCRQYP